MDKKQKSIKKKNKNKNKIRLIVSFVTCFIFVLILPTVSWTILSVADLAVPSIMETLDFDTGENRNKAELKISNGVNSLFTDIEKWYNDRVPFRSVILTAQKSFFNKLEEPYTKSIRPALIRLFNSSDSGEEYNPDFIDSVIDEIPDAEGHKYILASETEPTCKKEGVRVYRCRDCEKEEKIILPPEHIGEVIRVVEATAADYGYTYNRCTVCKSEYRSNISNRLPDDTYLPLVNHGLATEGKHNWLFYNGENSLAYYQGTNIMDETQLNRYTSTLVKLKNICDEKGIQLQYMIMPNKEQVYSEFMPDMNVQSESKRVEELVKYVKANSGIKIIYPINELKEAKPYWQLYKKHDTHWNSAGAFIATQELYKALGLKTTDLMTVKVTEKTVSGGDLINLGGLSSEVYKEDITYKISYKSKVELTYESGEKKGAGIRISESTATNKCNFVMVGDSFRTAMIPFLEKDFSRCIITHKNNIDATVVKQAIREADVLVVATIERQDQSWIALVETIINILSV